MAVYKRLVCVLVTVASVCVYLLVTVGVTRMIVGVELQKACGIPKEKINLFYGLYRVTVTEKISKNANRYFFG